MSTEKKNQNEPQKEGIRIALIGSLIIMVITVGIGATSYYLGKKEGAKEKSPIPIIDISKTTNQKVLGAKTFNWNGKILKIEPSKLTFSTTIRNENNQVTTKEIIALIKPSTQFLKWDLTKPPAVDQPDTSKEPITFDQLRPGQQIIVQAANDINSNNEINATAISLLITPTTQ